VLTNSVRLSFLLPGNEYETGINWPIVGMESRFDLRVVTLRISREMYTFRAVCFESKIPTFMRVHVAHGWALSERTMAVESGNPELAVMIQSGNAYSPKMTPPWNQNEIDLCSTKGFGGCRETSSRCSLLTDIWLRKWHGRKYTTNSAESPLC
jgi:hypothetical protein